MPFGFAFCHGNRPRILREGKSETNFDACVLWCANVLTVLDIFEQYVAGIIHYWWLLMFGLPGAANTIYKWFHPERKDLPIPHWLRVYSAIGILGDIAVETPRTRHKDLARHEFLLRIPNKRDSTILRTSTLYIPYAESCQQLIELFRTAEHDGLVATRSRC
jgi:hypothetical protein